LLTAVLEGVNRLTLIYKPVTNRLMRDWQKLVIVDYSFDFKQAILFCDLKYRS